MAYSSSDYGVTRQGANGTVLNFAKVFGLMFALLIVTGLTALGLGAAFTNLPINAVNGITIGASIVTVILSFVLEFAFLKNGKTAFPIAVVYAACMGVLLASFVAYLPWQILSSSFLITAGIFGLMALVALIGRKANMNIMALVGAFLLLGVGGMFGFSFLFMIFFPGFAYGMICAYMVISFAAIMLITIADIWSVGKICANGDIDSNLSLFLAVKLYSDFIQIFIRIVWILIQMTRR